MLTLYRHFVVKIILVVIILASVTEGYVISDRPGEDSETRTEQKVALVFGRGTQTMIVEMDLISDRMANFACIIPIKSGSLPVVEGTTSEALKEIYWLLQGPNVTRFESISSLLWPNHPASRLAKVQDPRVYHTKVLGPGVPPLDDWLKENGFNERDMSNVVVSSDSQARTFFAVAYVGLAKLYRDEIAFIRNQKWLADAKSLDDKVEKAFAGFTYDRKRGLLRERVARSVLLKEPFQGSEISEDPLNREYDLLTKAEYDGLVERYGIGKEVLLRTFPFWSRGETFLDMWSKRNYREITFWNGSERVVLLQRDSGDTLTHGGRQSDDPTYSEQEIEELRELFSEYGPLVHDRFKEVRSILWDELREHPKTQIFDTLETALGALRRGIPISLRISFKTPAPHIPAAMVSPPAGEYRDSVFESPGPKRGRFTAHVFTLEPMKGTGDTLRIERWTRLETSTKAELSRYLPVYDAQVASTLSFTGSPSDLAGDVTFTRMNAREEATYSAAGLAAAKERIENTMMAIQRGDLEEVKRLVAEGVDLSADGRFVHIALAGMRTQHGRGKEIIEYLLDNGADVNGAGWERDTTPLLRIVQAGDWADEPLECLEIAELLIDRGGLLPGKRRKGTGSGFLVAAARLGRAKVVAYLLENGVAVNSTTRHEETALHAAAKAGNTEIARLLIANGADTEAQCFVRSVDLGGMTRPIDCAAQQGHVAMVKLLCEHGADLNGKRRSGGAPLWYAAKAGHKEVVKLLLEKGAYPRAFNYSQTAAEVAARSGHGEIADLIRSYENRP